MRLHFCLPVRALALCILLLSSSVLAAQEDFELVVPDELRPLLEKYLSTPPERADALPEASSRVIVLRRARSEITSLLATEGYFSPRVEGEGEAAEAFRIVVTPGRRTLVSSVELNFRGALMASDAARATALHKAWGLAVGQPFRQADWDAAKQQLLDALTNQDYAAADFVSSKALIDPEVATAALSLEVDSGPAFVFGPLEISGLVDYPSGLVARFNPPRPGEAYSQDRLLRFQSALQNTAYFASVLVDVDRASSTPGAVPVRVQLTEAQPKRLGFGTGYSSNTGYRVETSYRDANLLHEALGLVSGLRMEEKRQLGYVDVFLPPDLDAHLDSVGALAERSDISGLVTQRQSVGVQRTLPRGNIETRLGLNYQHEILSPLGSTRSSRNALTANWSWTRRTVDKLLDPREGQVVNVQIGGASQALLSDRNFARFYGRYQLLVPQRGLDVLILRAEGGITVASSRDGVPQDFLFRTGGAQSVRGYAYQSLGVKDGAATVGGRYLAVSSAEYVHWYRGDWGLAGFVDAGNANDERHLFKMNYGYGLGPRWKSPAGPLAVDLAYGQSDRRVRLQFAVAIAF